MSKEDLYRMEEERNIKDIAEYLEKVAGDLRNGTLKFNNGISIRLPETVILDIDVDRREKPETVATSVEIELKWTE